MNLFNAEIGREYVIESIFTGDDELESFLFSLGCYAGEKITLVSKRRSGGVVAIKDGRYSFDSDLLKAIDVVV